MTEEEIKTRMAVVRQAIMTGNGEGAARQVAELVENFLINQQRIADATAELAMAIRIDYGRHVLATRQDN